MKAIELMVGDYLTFPDVQNDSNCPKLRVIAINEEDVYVSNDGDPVADLCDPTELSGIPITPEILEKNGVVKPRLSLWWLLDSHFRELWLSQHTDGSWWLYPSGDCDKAENFAEIRFVHELQHALRLCGIDKEIEL